MEPIQSLSDQGGSSRVKRQTGLSYKFQRLRERIRQAVVSGELSGKLPGERVLARRFHVNAKTLSKALTDLAAEGLLDRSIGRGTYVKGSAPVQDSVAGRWLVLCDPEHVDSLVVRQLRRANADIEVVTEVSAMRPSFIRQFSAVIDIAANTPDSFVRDLVVRNVPVVAVGHSPRTYLTHAVMIDRALATDCLTRELILSGHRHLAIREPSDMSIVSHTARKTAARYVADAVVESFKPDELALMVENGVTAIICGTCREADRLLAVAEKLDIDIPGKPSVCAIGCAHDDFPCTGYFVSPAAICNAIAELLRDGQSHRPTTLWLTGQYVERKTTSDGASAMEPRVEMHANRSSSVHN